MEFELLPESLGKARKTAGVFLDSRFRSLLLAQDGFAIYEFNGLFLVRKQCGEAIEILLRSDKVAVLPASVLVDAQHGNKLGQLDWSRSSEETCNIGPLPLIPHGAKPAGQVSRGEGGDLGRFVHASSSI